MYAQEFSVRAFLSWLFVKHFGISSMLIQHQVSLLITATSCKYLCMMEITRVVVISLVFLCGVRDAHADTNLTALTGQVRVLTATIQAWKGRVVNIKTDMKQHFKRWESSLKNQLTETFLPALINPLVKQAITGILKEYNIRDIISGHVLDVVNNMTVSVQYTKTQLQAVKQQLRRVERERDNYKESMNQDIHSLQLQLNETAAGLLDAKMVNTVLREDLITLKTSCVKREETEARTNDEQSYRKGLEEMQQTLRTDIQKLNIQINQTIDDLHDSNQGITGLTEDMVTLNASCVKREEVEERTSVEQLYREGLQEMQRKIKTDIQSLNIQLNQTIDDLHDSKQVITGLTGDMVTLNASCVMREDIKEVDVTDRSLTTSSLSQVSFTTSPPSFPDAAGASSDPSRTERRPVTTKKPATQASSDPSQTARTAVTTTKKPATQATPSLADCYRLGVASRTGNVEEVKRLLSRGVDINCRGVGSTTPVIVAAYSGHRDVVELLVSKGADVSLVDKDSDNILHLACLRGHLETVKFVLSLNVVDINSRGQGSMTPVMRAAMGGHRDVVELLVSKGADVSLVDKDGDNILHLACMRGHMETVRFVLSLNVVDINSRGLKSTTPVMRAAMGGHRDVMELLMSKGADVSLVDGVGNNILHIACMRGHLETVGVLLSLNVVDINRRGQGSMTPVMVAAVGGHRDVMELLVSKGAHLSLVDKDGDNVLHLACGGGHMETVRFVLSLNLVDINSRGLRGTTPMMRAAVGGHRDVMELLVSKGADVSLVDGVGNNVLHLACMIGEMETVEFVLSLNVVDIDARNYLGTTAADLARLRGHQPVVDLLVSRGAQ